MLKAINPQRDQIGFIGAKVAVEPEKSLVAAPARRFRGPQRIRLHLQGSRRRPPAGATSRGCPIANRDGTIVHNEDRADAREHGRAAVGHAGLQARPDDRELLHRLSEASLRLLLHRPRLQLALHLLPVAADRRRPPLPRALGGERRRGGEVGEGDLPAGEGVLLRRRHASPTTCRASRSSPGSSASSASPGRATPRPMCRARRSKS